MTKIAEVYEFEVYVTDKINELTIEWADGTLHMNILDGSLKEEIIGDLYYSYKVLSDWYCDMKQRLLDMYKSGKYEILPKWEED